MGKSAPSPPKPPSAQETAAADQQTALWNASLANVDQYTPLGNINYELLPGTGKQLDKANYDAAVEKWRATQTAPNLADYNGDTRGYNQALRTYNQNKKIAAPDSSKFMIDSGTPPQYRSDISLSPEMQALFGQTMQNQNSLAGTAGGLMDQIDAQTKNPVDYGSFIKNPTLGDIGGMSERAQQAIMSRLQPDFDLQNEQMNSKLLNQGITPGSAAWENEWRVLNNAQNDARQQAVLSSDQMAANMQGTALAGRNQQINEAYQEKQAPINQYSAIMGNTQVQMPQFSSAPSAGAPGTQVPSGGQALQQRYAQQMQGYNANLASQNQTMGGLFGLGSSLLPFIFA